jgi:putative holliday junction resolvase
MTFERYLALDVGSRRIGIAVSDPLLITAQPLKTILRQPEKASLQEIQEICKEYNVLAIIVGLPKNMDGSLGSQAQDAQYYAKLLEENLKINIIFEDERLTSKEAERMLIFQNKKPSRNKELVDMAAAAIILQQYLNKRR